MRPRPRSFGRCASAPDAKTFGGWRGRPAARAAARSASASRLRSRAASSRSSRRSASTAFALAGRSRSPISGEAARACVVDEVIVATGFRPDFRDACPRSASTCIRGWNVRAALGPADRSQRAQLRHRAPAWRGRAGAAGAGLLHRRDEELRARADLPDDDRLRAGPLGRGRARRRLGGGARDAARAAGNRRLRGASATVPSSPRTGAGCCGGPAQANADACCVADEAAKASGKAGCGCGTTAPALPSVAGGCNSPANITRSA